MRISPRPQPMVTVPLLIMAPSELASSNSPSELTCRPPSQPASQRSSRQAGMEPRARACTAHEQQQWLASMHGLHRPGQGCGLRPLAGQAGQAGHAAAA